MSSTSHQISPPSYKPGSDGHAGILGEGLGSSRGGEGGGRLFVSPMGLDSDQLKARLYAKSELHGGHNKPVFRVARQRPQRDEVG